MNYLEWRETHEKVMRHKLDEDGTLPYEEKVLNADLDVDTIDAAYGIFDQTTESFIAGMKVMIEYLHEKYFLNATDLLFLDSIAIGLARIARRDQIAMGELNTPLTYIDYDLIKMIVTQLKHRASLEIDKTLDQLLLSNKMNPLAIWVKHPDASVEERNGIDSMDQSAFRIDADSARKAIQKDESASIPENKADEKD